MSVNELASTIRKVIAVLPTEALAQAYALLDEAATLYTECATGTVTDELPKALLAIRAACDTVTASHQSCGQVSELLERYLAHLGTTSSTTEKGTASASPTTAETTRSAASAIKRTGPANRPWQTVAEEEGAAKAYRSYSAAKRALGSKPRHELHHIVEQCQAKPERSGFETERINTTDNLVWLPTHTHRKITTFYARKPPGVDTTRRDAMNGMSWDEQYRRGQRAITRALREDEQHD